LPVLGGQAAAEKKGVMAKNFRKKTEKKAGFL